ncbi:MAG TPA: hypothetical protein VNJ06_13185 [Gemmatimonadales bacterium]|nr:hypothetical protein [Gemmatimonadales bacterium]
MSPIRSLLVLAAAALPAACTHDSFTPNINSVVGDYHLQSLTTTDLGGPRDWVALGATLTLSLAPNGTTSGRLFMPGGGLGGSDVDVSMEGTWTLAVATVEFYPSYDTLLRDVTFIASENRMIGDHAYGGSGVSVRIILTK